MSQNYTGLAPYYDQIMGETDYENWALFVLKLFKKYKITGNSIIDLGAGTGILAEELSNLDYKIDLLDIAKPMLNIAKKRSYKSKPQFFEKDLSDFTLKKKYDIAICLNNGINYIPTKTKLKNTFKCIHAILNEGGTLILDTCSIYYFLSYFLKKVDNVQFPDFTFFRAHQYDEKKNVAKLNITIYDHIKGKAIVEKHDNFLYGDEDIVKASKKYFECLGVLGGFSLRKRHEKSKEIYYIFRKKP